MVVENMRNFKENNVKAKLWDIQKWRVAEWRCLLCELNLPLAWHCLGCPYINIWTWIYTLCSKHRTETDTSENHGRSKTKVTISTGQKRFRNTKQSVGQQPEDCWALEWALKGANWKLSPCGERGPWEMGAGLKAWSQRLRWTFCRDKKPGWPWCQGLGKQEGEDKT